jgi:hypothetical protein
MRRSVRRAIPLVGVVAVVLWARAPPRPIRSAFTVTGTPASGSRRARCGSTTWSAWPRSPRSSSARRSTPTRTGPHRKPNARWAARTAPDLAVGLTLTVAGAEVPLDDRLGVVRPARAGGGSTSSAGATFAGPLRQVSSCSPIPFGDRIGWREVTAAVPTARRSSTRRSPEQRFERTPVVSTGPPGEIRWTSTGDRRFQPGVACSDGRSFERAEPTVATRRHRWCLRGSRRRTGPFMLVALLLAFRFGALRARARPRQDADGRVPGRGRRPCPSRRRGRGLGGRDASARCWRSGSSC